MISKTHSKTLVMMIESIRYADDTVILEKMKFYARGFNSGMYAGELAANERLEKLIRSAYELRKAELRTGQPQQVGMMVAA